MGREPQTSRTLALSSMLTAAWSVGFLALFNLSRMLSEVRGRWGPLFLTRSRTAFSLWVITHLVVTKYSLAVSEET